MTNDSNRCWPWSTAQRFNSSECPETATARRFARPVCFCLSRLTAALLCLWIASTSYGQTIQLSWNPNPTNENVLGYKVWQSFGTGPFSQATTATGSTVTLPLNTNAIIRWYAVAYNSGGDSLPSNTITNLPAIIPQPAALTFEAEAGTLTVPFYSAGTYIQQDSLTGLADGGRAVWAFGVNTAGTYAVSILLNAPSEGANSLFLNIDGEPTDPACIWDVPVTTGFQDRIASWRGTGGFNTPEFAPKTWSLSTGSHTLIVRGREGGLQLDRITIQNSGGTTNPPPPVQLPPSAPTGLKAVKITSTRLDLGWTSDLATITKVERSIDAAPFGEIDTLPPGTQHTSTTFARNRKYVFRARSLNSIGSSGYSNLAYFESR